MIGDCCPHAVSYTDQHINWHDELEVLTGMGVKVSSLNFLKSCLSQDKPLDLTSLRDKQLDLFEKQITWPFWIPNHLTFMMDKQHDLFEGQRIWPFWGINILIFLRDKHLYLFEGQMIWPFWGTNNVTFLRDKQLDLFKNKWHDLFEGQTTWPFRGTNGLTFLRDKWCDLWLFWGTNDLKTSVKVQWEGSLRTAVTVNERKGSPGGRNWETKKYIKTFLCLDVK